MSLFGIGEDASSCEVRSAVLRCWKGNIGLVSSRIFSSKSNFNGITAAEVPLDPS